MKPFTFRLEAVLTLRDREEQQAREIFGRALRQRAEAEGDVACAHRELEAIQEAISGMREQASSATEQLLLIRSWRWSSESAHRLELALSAAETIVEQKRQLFLAARQRHEALKKLKERQRQAHAAGVARHEETEIADFITGRYGRQSLAA